MPRTEAQALVMSLGGRITDSVSKSVDYVVVGREPGSKYEKARSMDKMIMNERQFLELVKKK
jgi:DNA ligase (NAD+)